MKKDIFLSYSHTDKDLFSEIKSFLSKNGLTLWYDDKDVGAGKYLVDEISKGISDSRGMVCLYSSSYFSSGYCSKEIYTAIDKECQESNYIVIVLRIDDTELPDVLRSKVWLDFRDQDAMNLPPY